LGAEHGARPGDSDPTNEGFSTNLVVLHAVESDQGACAAESRLAVDGDSAGLWVGKVLLAGVDKPFDDFLGRSRAIWEDHVIMGHSIILERVLVVLGVVQTHHARHV
jgi:hypothetical protein